MQRKRKPKVSKLILLLIAGLLTLAAGCDRMSSKEEDRTPVARVGNSYLYLDELQGITSPGVPRNDSVQRVEAYVDSWIRKQLLIQEATRRIDINEAEVERRILDYRYSIIAYEYQAQYVRENLDTAVSQSEIEQYYKENLDNFILKQNIVQATFIKVPKTAPRIEKIKDMIFSTGEKDVRELKSYCLSFAAAFQLADSSWMVFDDLVRNSPIAEIPNKIQFLKANPYYETSDDNYLYFLKVNSYRISDNVSPLEFVSNEIRNIILNKRKVQLASQLEDKVYDDAAAGQKFEIYK